MILAGLYIDKRGVRVEDKIIEIEDQIIPDIIA